MNTETENKLIIETCPLPVAGPRYATVKACFVIKNNDKELTKCVRITDAYGRTTLKCVKAQSIVVSDEYEVPVELMHVEYQLPVDLKHVG